jgi:hypothetical protein
MGVGHEGFDFGAVVDVDDKLPLLVQEVAEQADHRDIDGMVNQPLADSDHQIYPFQINSLTTE